VISIVARHASRAVLAGPKIATALDGLLLAELRIERAHRCRGLGWRQLGAAEPIARERARASSWLDAFSFPAPEVYERSGV